MCPTNGSDRVLKTKAVVGPFASLARSTVDPSFAITSTGPRSSGDGNSSAMKVSSLSIPIGAVAAPAITGASFASANPALTPRTIKSSSSVPDSRYVSIKASSDSATASISFSRAESAAV